MFVNHYHELDFAGLLNIEEVRHNATTDLAARQATRLTSIEDRFGDTEFHCALTGHTCWHADRIVNAILDNPEREEKFDDLARHAFILQMCNTGELSLDDKAHRHWTGSSERGIIVANILNQARQRRAKVNNGAE